MHHRDPFARMLVGLAIVERLTIVTRDESIPRYPVPVIAA
jgi:PIN domain nuclease of toxin-antitoxin system